MVEFADRLKALRTQKHLTQKELANILGVQNSIISFYETGERTPSLDMIIKLSKYFHVSTDYLLGVAVRETIDISDLSEKNKIILQELADSMRTK